jgi:hypothetical protein
MSKATWGLHYSQVLQFGVYVKSRMDSSGALPAIPRGLRSDSHRPLASTLLVVAGERPSNPLVESNQSRRSKCNLQTHPGSPALRVSPLSVSVQSLALPPRCGFADIPRG